MFLNIGGGIYLDIRDIICIFDTEKTDDYALRRLTEKASRENLLFLLCEKSAVRSAVLAYKNNKSVLYLVPSPVGAIGRRRTKPI